jgi:hypothetical protein
MYQLIAAWGGGRKDYSVPAGKPSDGVNYFFTKGMLPAHKETVSKHPYKFLVGVVMHAGALYAIFHLIIMNSIPFFETVSRYVAVPLVMAALPAGLYLLVRRAISSNLRKMSAPDDYVAAAVTCGLLVMTILYGFYPNEMRAPLFIYGAVLFFYMPLGKLRHIVFFFAARYNLGGRLGRRGVFPPQNEGSTDAAK